MSQIFNKQSDFNRVLRNATYASLNGAAALAFASVSLAHFRTQLCLDIRDTENPFNGKTSFCLPNKNGVAYTVKLDSFVRDSLGQGLADPLLNFSAGVFGILSMYFARESYNNLKNCF